MKREKVEIAKFNENVFALWENRWFLLTGGDFSKGEYNTMTVGWGSIGVVWGVPFVQVFVRPTRYTMQFMDQYPTFTLCAFPKAYRAKLSYLGSVSGKDVDKIAESGLTPTASQIVAAPSFEEADLCIECEKMYWQDLDPQKFLDPKIEKNYSLKDYHRIYYGAVKAIYQEK